MLALTLDTAKDLALAIAVGAIVLAIVAAFVVRAVVGKLLTVAVLAAIAIAAWSQRAAVQDCADRVRTDARADTTCSFFGQDVTVPL